MREGRTRGAGPRQWLRTGRRRVRRSWCWGRGSPACARRWRWRGADGTLVARGLRLEDGEEVMGDLVVDAGGRASPMPEWLDALGARPPESFEDCQILYYTRFYQLAPGQGEPPRGRFAPTGDLGY